MQPIFTILSRRNFFNPILSFVLILHFSLQHTVLLAGDNTCSRKEEYCVGTRSFPKGVMYEGEFRYGIPHGWGNLYWPNGDHYEGHFYEGFRQGSGVQTYHNGDRYEGEFFEGYLEGKGVYIWANGDVYSGNFYNDKMAGKGLFQSADGEIYDGEWVNGVSEGEGIYTKKDGSRYIGKFKNGDRHGHGMIVWSNGSLLRGKWKKGALSGTFEMEFDSEVRLKSELEDGFVQNPVSFTCHNGQVITCDWDRLEEKLQQDAEIWEAHQEHIGITYYALAMEAKQRKDKNTFDLYLMKAMDMANPSSDLKRLCVEQMADKF